MSVRDIVHLVDLNSEAAGRYAVSLASIFEARLALIAVVIDPTTSLGFTEASVTFVASALEKSRDAAQNALSQVAEQAHEAGVAVETELVETAIGDVVETVGRILR